MVQGFMQFGVLVVGMALTMGPVVLWAMLLNLRDRREARMLGTVLAQVSSRDLLGRIAVRVRCGWLSPRSLVTVHILMCSPDEVWEIMTRLSQRLSPRARLAVTGPVDQHSLATFTVQRKSRPPLARPSRPTLATG